MSQEEGSKEQCNSKGPRGVQCSRGAGHSGEHWSGPFTWEDPPSNQSDRE